MANPAVPLTVNWSPIVRATDDDSRLAGLGAHPLPTLTANGTNGDASLQADSVGSFHLRAYVDIGGAPFDATIDKPPYTCVNLVLVHAVGVSNSSTVPNAAVRLGIASTNHAVVPASNPTDRSDTLLMTGAGSLNNAFASGPNAAVWHKASVQVVGGGSQGLRGLDRVFGGWIQNLDADNFKNSCFQHVSPPAGGLSDYARFDIPQARLNFAGESSAPWFEYPHTGWTLLHGPILDRNRGNLQDWGSGGNSACGLAGAMRPGAQDTSMDAADWLQPAVVTSSAPPSTLPLGQVWQIEEWDSPSTEFSPFGPHFRLTRIDYELHFRADLCLWTNRCGWPGSDMTTPSGTYAMHAGNGGATLYSSLYSNTWVVHAVVTFDATHAAQLDASSSVTINASSGTPAARPVEGTGLEVRWPIVLHTIGAARTPAGEPHRPH
jgi:hypothetical protein